MTIKSKSWLVIGLVVVMFFAGILIGKKQPSPSVPAQASIDATEQSVESPEIPAQGDSAVEDPPGTITQMSSDGRTSYRVNTSAAKARKPRPPAGKPARADTNWEDGYQAKDTIESALQGDEDDTIAVAELISQCRAGYQNDQQLEAGLNQVSKSVKMGNSLPGMLIPGTGETIQFNSFVEYEELMWTRYAECQSTNSMFDSQLRQRLEAQAREGSVTARFLYAMWLPPQTGLDSGQMVDWITYQSLAWDFTWANIREGEPLGLLAYGRSLEQSGSIYFTPRHLNFGPAFIMAAHKCGMDNGTVNQKVDNMTGYWNQRNMTQRMNTAETLSEEIVSMFCR